MDWVTHSGTLLIGTYTPSLPSSQPLNEPNPTAIKIAGFDLDGTLITTSSGALHASSPDDWKWCFSSVPAQLRAAHAAGFFLVVITNQGRLTDAEGREAPEAGLFKAKAARIAAALDVPLTVYAACANDNWRKPRVGIWELLLAAAAAREGRRVDEAASVFVGDAAGRERDHTDADYHYALNIGIAFQTPEAYFLGEKGDVVGHKFDPAECIGQTSWTDLNLNEEQDRGDLLVLVGAPGSGKTTFYRTILEPMGYIRVSLRQELGNNGCLIDARKRLGDGQRVVIDMINSTAEERRWWLDSTQSTGKPATAIYLDVSRDLCLHNDTVRAIGSDILNSEGRPVYPRTAFLKLWGAFSPPEQNEGFFRVIRLGFQWMGTDDEMRIWRRYWI